MKSVFAIPALAAALLVGAPGALAEDDSASVTWGTGVFYTTGKYGYDEATDIVRIPLDVSVTAGRLTVFGELPWLYADGPAGAVAASQYGGFVTRYPRLNARLGLTGEADSSSVSGLGDATLGATARLTGKGGPTWAGLTVLATVPTGDEDKGLGTGTTDVSAELALEHRVGATALTGAAGYTWLGDKGAGDAEADPPLSPLEDYAYARIGLRHDTRRGGTVGAGLAWSESADPVLEDIVELSLSWGRPVSDTVWFGTYVSGGLAGDGSDFGAGITLSVTP